MTSDIERHAKEAWDRSERMFPAHARIEWADASPIDRNRMLRRAARNLELSDVRQPEKENT